MFVCDILTLERFYYYVSFINCMQCIEEWIVGAENETERGNHIKSNGSKRQINIFYVLGACNIQHFAAVYESNSIYTNFWSTETTIIISITTTTTRTHIHSHEKNTQTVNKVIRNILCDFIMPESKNKYMKKLSFIWNTMPPFFAPTKKKITNQFNLMYKALRNTSKCENNQVNLVGNAIETECVTVMPIISLRNQLNATTWIMRQASWRTIQLICSCWTPFN